MHKLSKWAVWTGLFLFFLPIISFSEKKESHLQSTKQSTALKTGQSNEQGTYNAYEKRLLQSVRSYKLNNGLRLLTVKRDKSPTLSLYIRFLVGSVDEDYQTTGTAHLLEHMLFKGTDRLGTRDWDKESKLIQQIDELGRAVDFARREKYPQEVIDNLMKELRKWQKEARQYVVKDPYDAIYKQHGSQGFNASTSVDITTYKISLPKNRLKLWAYIESERLRNPVLREYYLERDVVLEERRMRTDGNGSGLLYESFLSTAFQAHPYRHPIIGWKSVIPFLDRKKTEEFFRTYYVPNNMVIVLVGDLDGDRAYEIINKYFGSLKRGPAMERTLIKEPEQLGERRTIVHHQDQPMMFIGYHKPAMPSREDYVFDVIDSLLSDGRTSRFYQELVIKEKVASNVGVYAALPGSRYPNLFTIYATPRSPHTNETLLVSMDRVLQDFIRTPVSAKELAKVKNQMLAQFIRQLGSNGSLASSLSYYEILVKDWKYMLHYRQNIETITPEEIQQVARKYLQQNNRTIAILNQISQKSRNSINSLEKNNR